MIYRCIAVINQQVSFGNVGFMRGIMNQYPVPGSIPGWTRQCHLLIPFFTALVDRVNINDDATIIEQFVNNHLSYGKFGSGLMH